MPILFKIRVPFQIITGLALFLTSCSGLQNITIKHDSSASYDFRGDTVNGWSLARQDSLWGYISADSRRAVKYIFTWADDFSDSMALVQDKGGYRYVNHQGKFLRTVKAPHAYSFSEGLAAVQKQDKWGYINRQGKWLIKPQYDWAFPFSENRAAIAIGFQQGYINREGYIVIQPAYDEAEEFTEGIAIVRKNARYGLIDTLGNQLLPTHLKSISLWEKDFYKLETPDKKIGLANSRGDLVLDTIYNEITLIKETYIRAKLDGKVGHFDLTGHVVIPLVYDFIGFVSEEGFMVAEKDGKNGFLNTQGEEVLPFEYEACRMGFSDGRTWVKKDGELFLMDHHFDIIKEVPYNDVYYFNNGFAIVSKESDESYKGLLYGYVNKLGEEVISPKYQSVFPFNKYGLTIVGTRKDGLTDRFLINSEGTTLPSDRTYSSIAYFGLNLIYASDSDFTFISPQTGQEIRSFPYTALYPLKYSDRQDLARVNKGTKKGLIDTTLTELLPPVFDNIREYVNDRLAILNDGLWGFADHVFRVRIPFLYDEISSFKYGLAEAEKDNLKGAVNKNGRVVVPLQYGRLTIDHVSNRIYAKKEHGYDVYDMEGRLLLDTDFEYLGGYWGANHTTFRKDDKMGALDFYLQVLCEPIYDRIGPFRDGLAWVVNKQQGGFINEQFEIVVPVELDELEEFAFGFSKVRKGDKEYYIDTKGREIFPDKEKIKEREAEIQRRKDSFFNFSS